MRQIPAATHPSAAHLLVLGAVGVVFGDLGTSPLYTLQEVFSPAYGLAATRASVLGVLSLIFWALVLVVCIKYVVLVMRADNGGEGGIVALLALARHAVDESPRRRAAVALLGIFGAALFYGDGVITPAISVLSAVEGLHLISPALGPFVLPTSVAILLGLFALQRYGSTRVSALFAPIMCLWFVAIAALGAAMIVRTPAVLLALNPVYGWQFFAAHGMAAFVALGGVVLALTGAEALYADMGHFGKRPIRLAWLILVFPALLLNYFGQGALLLDQPAASVSPFYQLVPRTLLIPMVVLATMATVIASQAVISGAFSMTHGAMRLGYFPRMRMVHTSARITGQVFVPWINGALLLLVLAAVLGFRSSDRLGGAYGVAVTGTMIATTTLLLVVARYHWRWPLVLVLAVGLPLLLLDGAFFSANLLKIHNGGWFPLVLGVLIFTVMTTWHRGRRLVRRQVQRDTPTMDAFLARLTRNPPRVVAGTAVFLSAHAATAPPALRLGLRSFGSVHQCNIIVRARTLDVPFVNPASCASWQQLSASFHTATLRFGYMQAPDIPAALARTAPPSLGLNISSVTYFLSDQPIFVTRRLGLALWRERLFAFLSRNAPSMLGTYRLPPAQVVEMNTPREI